MQGIIHGTWIAESSISGRFVLWAEKICVIKKEEQKTRKRSKKKRLLSIHPYCIEAFDLMQTLESLFSNVDDLNGLNNISKKNDKSNALEILIPSIGDQPVPSPELIEQIKWSFDEDISYNLDKTKTEWWKIAAIELTIDEIYELLLLLENHFNDFKQSIVIGSDLQFWIKSLSFFEEVIRNQSYLPVISINDDYLGSSSWRVFPFLQELRCFWLDLIQQMPVSCRSYRELKSKKDPMRTDEILTSFYNALLNQKINDAITNAKLAKEILKFPRTGKRKAKKVAKTWLSLLIDSEEVILEDSLEIYRSLQNFFKRGLETLTMTTYDSPASVCFQLESPIIQETSETEWKLSFWLQSHEDPSLRIPAREVWKSRGKTLQFLTQQFINPQEILLEGLGKAMKIFSPIRPSLRSKNPEYCLLSTPEAFKFVQEDALNLKAAGFVTLIPRGTAKTAIKRPSVRLAIAPLSKGVLTLDNILDFKWQIAIGDDVLTNEEIKLLASLKMPLVNIRGQWVEVDPEEVKKTIKFWTEKAKGDKLSVLTAVKLMAHPSNSTLGLPIGEISGPDWLSKLFTDDKEFTLLETPTNLNGSLRPYQRRGMSWIVFMHSIGLNVCLADDMGLGKTIQSIAVILLMKNQRKIDSRKNSQKSFRTLIVCPTSVITNWGKEIDRFAPDIRWQTYHGPNRKKLLEESQDVLITSYGLVRRDLIALNDNSWELLIIDESQNIKNPVSGQSKAIRSLKASHKIALTGTPIENRLMELWSLFDFLQPYYLGNLKYFQRHYSRRIELFKDDNATLELQRLIKPFLLRRTKSDKKIIPDLPEKIELKNYCYLTKEQTTLYQSVVNQQLALIKEAEGIARRGAIFATMMKLKQICNHPAQFTKDKSALEGRSGKLKRMWEIIDLIVKEDERVLIFSQFVEMGKILKSFLQSRLRQKVFFLHGGSTRKERDQMIQSFQEKEDSPKIFILSLKAGGLGLNLTRANHVIHFDRWWNPSVENQATDRTYRIGQVKNVQVHKFICVGTIEERIEELIEKKKALAETFVGSGEEWLTSLTNDEFKDLITLSEEHFLEAETE